MPNYDSAYTGAEIDESVGSYLSAKTSGGYIDANTLAGIVATVKLTMYPVGSIYMSVESTDPGTFIGGTWQRIQDTFLLAAGSTYTAGGSGGNASHTHGYAHTHTTPATTTDSHTLVENELPVIDGSMTWHGQEHGTHIYNISGHMTGSKINGMYQTTGQTSGAYSYGSTGFKFVGGGGHTHGQKATTTNSQSTSTTDSGSNLPPYIAVYIWKRIA